VVERLLSGYGTVHLFQDEGYNYDELSIKNILISIDRINPSIRRILCLIFPECQDMIYEMTEWAHMPYSIVIRAAGNFVASRMWAVLWLRISVIRSLVDFCVKCPYLEM
jgi:hypothetical protein